MKKKNRSNPRPKEKMKQKMIGDRIIELTKSLQVIRDSIDLIGQGKRYQIIPLCGQLRALLTGTSKKKKNEPLLIDLSRLLDKKLSVFAMSDTKESVLPLKEESLFILF